jgi:hypothetical protein
VSSRDASLRIDKSVVPLRNLIAHGRVAASSPDLSDLKIVKFDRPKNGTVTVAQTALMNDAWFDSGIGLSSKQIAVVHSAYQRFCGPTSGST